MKKKIGKEMALPKTKTMTFGLSWWAALMIAGAGIETAQAKDLNAKLTGHWAKGMTGQAAACNHTYQLATDLTCSVVAEQVSMTLKDFISINDGLPSSLFNCSSADNLLLPPVVVCITDVVYQSTTGAAYNGTTGKEIPLPGANSANEPTFNGTITTRRITSTTRKASATATATGALAGNGTVVAGTAEGTATGDAAAQASAAAASEAAAAAAAAQASADAAASAAAAAASEQSASTPCNQIDGTLGPCEAYAATDSPPNETGLDIETQCLTLFNYARQHYNYGTWDYVWDPWLAEYAQYSANYAAYYDCSDCHTYSGSGYSWGQNLYLGEYDCESGYFGWVTNEAAGDDPANPEEGHFLNVVGFDIPYVSVGCAGASQNGNVAVVCNYGLVLLDDQTGLVPTF
ncbi:hypothetical protein HK100_011604 [Physocladia obscura]|uniref:Uncharacterized protein n=1 Tax=Physocladia obscura TaxID=109957 RepID=A0AAD5XGV0_9FUNG|nr:hypothetical protein HK100_011604 [Physocladia obscura]